MCHCVGCGSDGGENVCLFLLSVWVTIQSTFLNSTANAIDTMKVTEKELLSYYEGIKRGIRKVLFYPDKDTDKDY